MGELRALVLEYLREQGELQGSALATNELSFHAPLAKLLQQVAPTYGIRIVHEPALQVVGRPDFIFLRDDAPLGYLEVEAYGVNLDQLSGQAKSQSERFAQNLDNFLLTNCLEFRLYRDGALVMRALLPQPTPDSLPPLTKSELSAFSALLEAFFTAKPPPISDPKTLAFYLARRARQLASATEALLHAKQESELRELHRAFESVLLPNLRFDEFADMYAQTIAYGMFAARCSEPEKTPFTRRDAGDLIPPTNPFLRRLFQQVGAHDLDPAIAWIADEIANLLDRADIDAILQDFGRRSGREDPIVHFYEDFLQAYNPDLRELRGVYYTPEPVVHYIVGSVDEILKERFGKPEGLGDTDALVLDPACGTGSFLFAVVETIHQNIATQFGHGAWARYLKDGLLLNQIYGFELLVAPYAIAHLKLGLQMRQLGWQPQYGQRLGIYLTNALEQAVRQTEILLGEYISREANEAASIKREKPILVVLGNPPYSGHSANRSVVVTTNGKRELTWIGNLIEDYKSVDGQPLGERNPKWLQDDYVKFIRFAEWRISQTGQGVVGFITNHAYLDNPTFRGMRQHLMRTFDELYILNLHGNARKGERAPDGSADENVFDIQQGVAILLAVKLPKGGDPNTCAVHYADLWGTRTNKYQWLSGHTWKTTAWQRLEPRSPSYWFVPEVSRALEPEYQRGWALPEIFRTYSVGIVTARDKLTIQFNPDAVWQTVTQFVKLDPEVARDRFKLGKDVRDWKVASAQQDLREAGVPNESAKSHIVPILYRPFDQRYTFYTGTTKGFHCRPRLEVMKHLLSGTNLALISVRQQSTPGEWSHGGIANTIVESCVLSNRTKEIAYVFPLYLYNGDAQQNGLYDEEGNPANLNATFLKALGFSVTPEAVLGYIYAILHCPTYRNRYAEFLRRNFPRIPLPPSQEVFSAFAELGRKLIALHLLDTENAPELKRLTLSFPIQNSDKVTRVQYENERVWVNESQYFEPVSREVWEFRMGDHRVAERWLTERVGQSLSYSKVTTYMRIIRAIEETLKVMDAIDALWGEHFPV